MISTSTKIKPKQITDRNTKKYKYIKPLIETQNWEYDIVVCVFSVVFNRFDIYNILTNN